MRSFTGSATFHVDLPLAETRSLFTPEGERRWVSGWSPSYPDPERTEGVGAVFLVGHGDTESVWVLIDDAPDRLRYARVTGGIDAGIVDVHCSERDDGTTAVTVSYTLTALSERGSSHLDSFAAHYDEFIASWQRRIAGLRETPPPHG